MRLTRSWIALGLSLGLFPALVSAQSATPTPTPACTMADINAALAADLTCSTAGTVFFGTDISQFLLNQCAVITSPGETQSQLAQAQAACLRCAKQSAEAFRAAARAGLIHPDKSLALGGGKLRQLCHITDHSDDSHDGEPPESDAMKAMFDQLHLCLPSQGQSADKAQCVQCGTAVLDTALSSSVINQAKYDVIKKSLLQVCAGSSGDGDKHDGPPAPGPTKSPTPKPTPGAFDGFLNQVRQCVATLHGQTDACNACLAGITTEGLDPSRVAEVMTKAHNMCSASILPPT